MLTLIRLRVFIKLPSLCSTSYPLVQRSKLPIWESEVPIFDCGCLLIFEKIEEYAINSLDKFLCFGTQRIGKIFAETLPSNYTQIDKFLSEFLDAWAAPMP